MSGKTCGAGSTEAEASLTGTRGQAPGRDTLGGNDQAATAFGVAGITKIKQRDPAENEKNNIVQKAVNHFGSSCFSSMSSSLAENQFSLVIARTKGKR